MAASKLWTFLTELRSAGSRGSLSLLRQAGDWAASGARLAQWLEEDWPEAIAWIVVVSGPVYLLRLVVRRPRLCGAVVSLWSSWLGLQVLTKGRVVVEQTQQRGLIAMQATREVVEKSVLAVEAWIVVFLPFAADMWRKSRAIWHVLSFRTKVVLVAGPVGLYFLGLAVKSLLAEFQLLAPSWTAFFIQRLHDDYKQSLVDADCPNPLIMAAILLAEFQLLAPSWTDLDRGFSLVKKAGSFITPDLANDFVMAISTSGRQLYDEAMKLAREASPFQQHLMASKPAAWPLQRAIKRIQVAQDAVGDAVGVALGIVGRPVQCATEIQGKSSSTSFNTKCFGMDTVARVDFVVAHCREDLGWLTKQLQRVPLGARLLIYEKCGAPLAPDVLAAQLPAEHFMAVWQVDRADVGAARGDECSAYLTHILGSYENLADFTIFLQSDPMDHLHFDFLDLVLRSIAAGTYTTPFLPLNGPRHVRTLTPCLQAVHEEIFKENISELLGPYCCAQFAVSRDAIRRHDKDFYLHMLSLVDGSSNVDLCGMEGTKRSTQCYGFEFLWHVVFGEKPEPPGREDDVRLPLHLRLKHGKEHTRRNWIGVPLARDIPLKMFPDHEHGNPMHAE